MNLINKSWTEENLPDEWKTALLCPIPKQGKDSTLADSYRPICLLPTIAKLMERMVNNRIDWCLEQKQLLPEVQSGFRKQRSAYDQISLLESHIARALEENHTCIAVFLDMAGAFDAVDHTSVLFKLAEFGFSGRLVGWLQSYLANRKFKVLYRGEESTTRSIKCGVPQGGILSPLLFNVLMSDIPTVQGVQISVFADDIAVYAVGIDESKTVEMIQMQLDLLQR